MDEGRKLMAGKKRYLSAVLTLMILTGTACGGSFPQTESGMENSDTEMVSDDLESGENVGESGEAEEENDFKEPDTSVTGQPEGEAEAERVDAGVPDQSEEVVSETDQESENTEDDANGLTVTQSQYVYQDEYNDIEIYYPQIQGFADLDKAERINTLIENDVKKVTLEERVSEHLFCVYLNYEVKFLSENMISIFYKGMYGYTTPGHGLYATALATTIDLEKQKVLTLSDIVTDFDALSERLLDDQFESITTWEGITGTGQISRKWEFQESELIEYLKATEFDYERHYIEWYIGDTSFVIVSLKWGGYNEYSTNIESVKNLLNEEFYREVCEGQAGEKTLSDSSNQ